MYKDRIIIDLINNQKHVLSGSIDVSISGIIITSHQSPDDPVIYCNKAFEHLTGYSRSDIMGKNCRFLQGIDRSQKVRFELQLAVAKAQECHVEIINYRKDGTMFWNELYVAPIFDNKGVLIHNIGIQNDITEKKLKALALLVQQAQQSEMEQFKADFINTAGHEFKTPLTSARANLQLLARLMEKALTNEKQQTLLRQANVSLNKLSLLMEDMLGASKRKENQLSQNISRFNLSAVVQQVIVQCAFITRHEIHITGGLQLEVTADRDQIGQVIANILKNAVKYAPDSPKIDINISLNEREVKVTITDHGPGIPADSLPYIFGRYYRGAHSTLQISGLGLGLFVAKEILVSHGGQIGADSTYGQGSTFWFIFPQTSMHIDTKGSH